METIFWIAVLIFVFWAVFRPRPRDSKRRPQGSIPQPVLRKTTTSPKEIHLPPTKALPKEKIWKVGPEDVFKNEYVSFTRIKTFKTCPRMFELIYLYRFKDKSGRAAQVGSLIHKIVLLYTTHHKGRLSEQLRNDGAAEELLNFYEQAISSTDLTYHISKSELRPYLTNFVIINRRNDFQVQVTEHECDSTIGDYRLKCIIDRIDAGQIIIDYKTGKPENVVNHQLNVYAYALNSSEWTPYHVVFQFLKNGEIRDWQYTAQLHRTTEQWLLEGIEEIEDTRLFRRNAGRLCDYCGVSEYCYGVS